VIRLPRRKVESAVENWCALMLFRYVDTTVVHDNIAAFVVPLPLENLGIDKMIWYGGSGAVVNRIGQAGATGARA
jgi:hypothetical protein